MFQACLTDQYLQDIQDGVHQPGDTYKIALYLQSGATDKNKSATTYNTTGELPTAGGYTQGGIALTGRTSGLSGHRSFVDFDDPVWNPATITADAAIIYNASRSNKILVIMAMDPSTSTNAPFSIELASPGPITIKTL